MECRQNYIMNKCKCKTSHGPVVSDVKYNLYPYCLQLLSGDISNATNTGNDKTMCLVEVCVVFEGNASLRADCGCTPRCDDYNYQYSVSESKWPAGETIQSFLDYELRARKDKMNLKAYTQLQTVSIAFCLKWEVNLNATFSWKKLELFLWYNNIFIGYTCIYLYFSA